MCLCPGLLQQLDDRMCLESAKTRNIIPFQNKVI